MKTLTRTLFLILIVLVVYQYRQPIAKTITNSVVDTKTNEVLSYNEYYRSNNYLYVQNIEVNEVNNYQDILNMFYSIINSGDDEYVFYCNYEECHNDLKNIINDENIIGNINNFVHPFNSYKATNIDVGDDGRVTIKIKHVYTDEEEIFINAYINNFISNNITSNMSSFDKIKLFHDHIINNTIYDVNNTSGFSNAYTLLTTGKSICNGYSEIMSIYMHAIGIDNYRITSENHIWNLVKVDNAWYHLDATWDDPVTPDNEQYLLDTFFMINSAKLLELDKSEHNFNKEIFKEAN